MEFFIWPNKGLEKVELNTRRQRRGEAVEHVLRKCTILEENQRSKGKDFLPNRKKQNRIVREHEMLFAKQAFG